MKSILIIGMGRFGHHLAKNFLEHDHDVMIVDENEEKLEDMVPYATSTKIGDCTKEEVLKSIGIRNFDVVFVCIGTNFQSSLEITSLVKELGAKRVVSKATRDIQAKFLLRNGADEVIYPDKDIAEKWAERYSLDNLFDYIDLPGAFGIYEMPPLKEWVGKSIKESNIAARYKVSILGIKKQHDEEMRVMPSADYVIKDTDHLMVMAGNEVAERLLRQNRNHFVK
ncbi:MAG: TrkA family potassium uptake protein [Lachnospiraceae bacterium]|nr:TrkA family potassium uptake protein [Lachnospiraceae bacterium]MBO5144678.1 TrkA family potassium uptake protein [Lachnospiraceae bacterium]